MKMPTLAGLGTDLLRLSAWQRVWTLMAPFLCVGVYLACAGRTWWVSGVRSVCIRWWGISIRCTWGRRGWGRWGFLWGWGWWGGRMWRPVGQR